MGAASDLAKLDEPIRFHELRHTYASHAAINGMTLFVLAQNLGHVHTRMGERRYDHLSDQHERDMVRRRALLDRHARIVNNSSRTPFQSHATS
jgi:integrase